MRESNTFFVLGWWWIAGLICNVVCECVYVCIPSPHLLAHKCCFIDLGENAVVVILNQNSSEDILSQSN